MVSGRTARTGHGVGEGCGPGRCSLPAGARLRDAVGVQVVVDRLQLILRLDFDQPVVIRVVVNSRLRARKPGIPRKEDANQHHCHSTN